MYMNTDMMAIDQFIQVFQITMPQYQFFQQYHLASGQESYFIKLAGVLYRNQQSHLYFPMVVTRAEIQFPTSSHVWAWQGWAAIKSNIEQIMQAKVPKSIAPPCWTCFTATGRKCNAATRA